MHSSKSWMNPKNDNDIKFAYKIIFHIVHKFQSQNLKPPGF